MEKTPVPKRTWDDRSQCDIVLVNPPWITKDHDIWHGIKATMPPLGLLSIASYLNEKGLDAAIVDIHGEKLSDIEFEKRISALSPKIVGISAMTATSSAANTISRMVKKNLPGTFVIMGGVHADTLPGECLRNNSTDIVVHSDGEITFFNLCNSILKGFSFENIKGISYRKEVAGDVPLIHTTPPAEIIMDLDSLPRPAYHLVPMHKYHPAIGAYKRLPAINMLMTRGCPGKCSFCNSANTPLRTRNAELVVEEIVDLQKTYGIKEIQFYDDTFTISRKNVLKFCKIMQDRKIDVRWSAFARVDCIDEDIAAQMKKAGCHQIMLGIESGDPEILKKMGKPIQLDLSKKAVVLLRKAGIEARCAFVYGCEGETKDSLQKTLDFSIELDPDIAIFNIATPYPGTQLFEWGKKNGHLLHEDWTEYDLGKPVLSLPTIPPDEIVSFYQRSFKIFYKRPRVLFRKILRASSLSHWVDMIKAFSFIMLENKFGVKNKLDKSWPLLKKEEFFDYPELQRDPFV